MSGKTVTRADLADAVHQKIGLSRQESSDLVQSVLGMISDSLANGDSVKLSSFGSFQLRDKNGRIGRNPKTGEEVPIDPRRVLTFKPSQVLKEKVDAGQSKG
jgi:integration host factor subunit alpha